MLTLYISKLMLFTLIFFTFKLIMCNVKVYSSLQSIFRRDLKCCPMFSNLKTLSLNEYWCMPGEFSSLTCILEHSPVLEKLTLQLFCKVHFLDIQLLHFNSSLPQLVWDLKALLLLLLYQLILEISLYIL